MCAVTNRTSLILLLEPTLTLALLPMVYSPAEFLYRDKAYRDGHGAGSVFLDWLRTSDDALIGLQLDIDLLGLDAYGRSTFTEEVKQQQILDAERNLGRDYVTRQE